MSDVSEVTLKLHFLLALSLAFPLSALAGFDEGLAAAEKSDYLSALRHWQPLAAEGHAASQYNLGLMYEQGLGLPRNPVFAAHWIGKAAAQGLVSAQNHLAQLPSPARNTQSR
jgi:TPR repeat protein